MARHNGPLTGRILSGRSPSGNALRDQDERSLRPRTRFSRAQDWASGFVERSEGSLMGAGIARGW